MALDLQQFLAQPHNAIIGVNRPGKAPQLTPVWFQWDGTVFRFSTTRDRAKYLNIQRDPQISLIIDDVASHTYIVATGRAEIEDDATVPEKTRPLLQKYVPPEHFEQRAAQFTADPSR